MTELPCISKEGGMRHRNSRKSKDYNDNSNANENNQFLPLREEDYPHHDEQQQQHQDQEEDDDDSPFAPPCPPPFTPPPNGNKCNDLILDAMNKIRPYLTLRVALIILMIVLMAGMYFDNQQHKNELKACRYQNDELTKS